IDLFEGEQLVLVGRYKKPGTAKVTVTGAVGGKEQSFDFPAELVAETKDESFGFVEKLWAVRRVGEIIDELDLKGRNDELVKELVELSTRHGIMTPYTSFLADENVSLRALSFNTARAEENLSQLDETSGYGAFYQRSMKGALQQAKVADSARLAAPAARPAKPGRDDRFAGRALRGSQAAEPTGARTEVEVTMDEATEAVRNVGAKSFYRRGAQWVDSTVTEDQQKNAQRVAQFSDDYFKLANRHGRKLSQYLVFDEPALVELEGHAYLIEPPAE
ncbi:MAG: VIT domain-containing protein, partial [Candidatus Saccharimonadales bacterium]